MTLRLTLPWPPSVNRYYRSLRTGAMAGRVLISEEGRAYRLAVDAVVKLTRSSKCYDIPLVVCALASPPDRRARDLDNLWKPVLDALQHSGVFLNDSQIDELNIKRGPVVKGGQFAVSVAPIVQMEEVADTGWRQALGDEAAR